MALWYSLRAMTKPKIDRGSFRWIFFSEIAGQMNPDVEEARLAKSWAKKDPIWRDLDDAVRQLYLDPIVQVIADMSGESFERMRRITLDRAEKMTMSKIESAMEILTSGGRPRSDHSAAQSAEAFSWELGWLFAIDPFLGAWFVVHAVNIHGNMAKTNGLRWFSGQSDFWKSGFGPRLLQYQDELLETFSMTESAAEKRTLGIEDAARKLPADRSATTLWLRQSTVSACAMLSILRGDDYRSPAIRIEEYTRYETEARRTSWERIENALTSSLSLIQKSTSRDNMFPKEAFLEPLKCIPLYPPTPVSSSSGLVVGSSAKAMAVGAVAGAAASFAASKLLR